MKSIHICPTRRVLMSTESTEHPVLVSTHASESPIEDLSVLRTGVESAARPAAVVPDTEAAADEKHQPDAVPTTPASVELPPPNALDLIAIVDQFRSALRPLEDILKQHGARMSIVEFDATVDLVADMRKSLAALELSIVDDPATHPSAEAKQSPGMVPSQHLRDTQATAFQRIFRVTGMCSEVYRATKQFEIVNSARRAFADRVEQQNRALATSFGLDLDAIKADALAQESATDAGGITKHTKS